MIHDAIRDLNQWEEAITKVNSEDGEEGRKKRQAYEYQENVPAGTQYYCLVDASWKNDKEVAGVGWSLHSKGSQQLQGFLIYKANKYSKRSGSGSFAHGSTTIVSTCL